MLVLIRIGLGLSLSAPTMVFSMLKLYGFVRLKKRIYNIQKNVKLQGGTRKTGPYCIIITGSGPVLRALPCVVDPPKSELRFCRTKDSSRPEGTVCDKILCKS